MHAEHHFAAESQEGNNVKRQEAGIGYNQIAPCCMDRCRRLKT
jgi:hypothetical protein